MAGLGKAMAKGARAKPEKPSRPDRQTKPARPGKEAPGTSIEVGATENKPELIETIPITTQAGSGRRVALSLGPTRTPDRPSPTLLAATASRPSPNWS